MLKGFIYYTKFIDRYRISGIYCIWDIVENKYYIGASKNIMQRIPQLFAKVSKFGKISKVMENSNRSNFRIKILELCNDSELVEKEDGWIKKFLKENLPLYNQRGLVMLKNEIKKEEEKIKPNN